ncbi:MAG: NupC/NupG family nucleoside CNT transporter [Longimicrobiales bacterium]
MKRPSRGLLALWLVAGMFLATGLGLAVTNLVASAPGPDALDAVPAVGTSISAAAAPTQARGISPIGRDLDTPFSQRLRSLLGLAVLGLLAWTMSVNRKLIPWRVVIWGVALQLIFAVFILKTPAGAFIFDGLNRGVLALLGFTVDGASFIFGNLVWDYVPVGAGVAGAAGQGQAFQEAGQVARAGALFAFNVLPTIIFFSSLMTILYHLGIMQWVVKVFAWVMQRTMRTSGAETLSAAGNIFVGQTESPLLIKPFIEGMTMSELMAVMTGGFATVAGGVMAAYVGMLVAFFPDIAGHLMAASVMSAPAALVIAKIMYPEEEESETSGSLDLSVDRPDVNVIEAAARGASEGLSLALNVGAMLLAFVALVYMLNAILALMGGWVGLESLSLELILGLVFSPIAWVMGVPWADATTVGGLLGLKMALNEFFSYLQLANILNSDGDTLSPRSIVIVTYALSGFANFSSIAIQIGGIGGIAPNRRQDLSRLGLRAMIAGTIAAFMTATVAGMLI